MKTKKILRHLCVLLIALVSLSACNDKEETFTQKDSYLYVWNARCWTVGSSSTMQDIKVTFSFLGDTTRVREINFWVIKQDATLYAEEAMKHPEKGFQLKRITNDPDQKAYPKQCSFRFDGSITTDFHGDLIRVDQKYRLVIKAIGTDNMIVDSPTIESGLFEVFNPDAKKDKQ